VLIVKGNEEYHSYMDDQIGICINNCRKNRMIIIMKTRKYFSKSHTVSFSLSNMSICFKRKLDKEIVSKVVCRFDATSINEFDNSNYGLYSKPTNVDSSIEPFSNEETFIALDESLLEETICEEYDDEISIRSEDSGEDESSEESDSSSSSSSSSEDLFVPKKQRTNKSLDNDETMRQNSCNSPITSPESNNKKKKKKKIAKNVIAEDNMTVTRILSFNNKPVFINKANSLHENSKIITNYLTLKVIGEVKSNEEIRTVAAEFIRVCIDNESMSKITATEKILKIIQTMG
jgi:hypothetical protein